MASGDSPTGPLAGLRVVELASTGPASYTGMLLADLGADVARLDRRAGAAQAAVPDTRFDLLARGKRSIALDLKAPADLATALRLVDRADVLIDGFRPGVAERLGLGPDVLIARRRPLVYGRLTGWGQTGPLSRSAGHDINYVSLAGPIWHIGRTGGPPTVPLNLVGDMGGGALLLAFGIMAALVHSRATGVGQVVDAAMVDGAASMLTPFFSMMARGSWNSGRGANAVDGGSHFYNLYRTKDGKYVSIVSLEPQFFALLCELIGYSPAPDVDRLAPDVWEREKQVVADIFANKTRDEWSAILEGTDACYAPVLSMDEAPGHPHSKARKTFVEAFGLIQPAPVPRFSTGELAIRRPPCEVGEHDAELRKEWLGE
jgi:alpha-methylacyl-CoA racemase